MRLIQTCYQKSPFPEGGFKGLLRACIKAPFGGLGAISVRAEGLEPPCLAALDPKSSASANFATPAKGSAKVYFFERNTKGVLLIWSFVDVSPE